MTWLPWLLGALLLAAAGFLAACWWGSDVVFHPPNLLENSIWPDQFGLKYEKASFPAADGVPLAAWIIPAAEPTPKTLLLLHGWGDNKGDLLQRVHALQRRFNLFCLDHRAHGESGGTLSTIGYLESRDVAGALEFLRRERPGWLGHLGVFGLSMGGSVGLWAAAEHPAIRCAAVEAPFPSFRKVVTRWAYNAFRMPYFPCAWAALHVIRWRLGEDPEPYSPIYHVGRIAPRPLLFIVGGEDSLMPRADVRELYDRAGEPKEFWIVDGASHGKCAQTAGEAYTRRLAEFFERYL